MVLWYRGFNYPIFRWMLLAYAAVGVSLFAFGLLFDFGLVPRSFYSSFAGNLKGIQEEVWTGSFYVFIALVITSRLDRRPAAIFAWLWNAIFSIDPAYRNCVKYYSTLVPEKYVNPRAFVYMNEAKGETWFAESEYIAAVEQFYNNWWQQYRAQR